MVPEKPKAIRRNHHVELLHAGGIARIQISFLKSLAVYCEPARCVAAGHLVTRHPDDSFDISGFAARETQPLGDGGSGILKGALAAVQRRKGPPAVEKHNVAPADRLDAEVRP
jgi:hypothetical protein